MEKEVQNTAPRLDNITLARVLACIGVFSVHLGQRLHLEGSIRVITDFGENGVFLFFIISGVLAFWTYKSEEGAGYYWWKRAVRLLPLYYCIIIYDFVVHTFIYKDVPVDSAGLGWSRYFFFLSDIIGTDEIFWRNLSSTWTIPMFVSFYLLVPFLYKRIQSYRKSVVCMLGMFLAGTVVLMIGNGNLLILYYLFFFFIGIVIYRALKEEKEEYSIALFAMLALFFVIQSAINALVYSMLFAILIIATSKWRIWSKLLKGVECIDKYSYTIYLIQAVVFDGLIDNLIERYTMSKGTITLIAILATVIGSWGAHNLIEKPIQGKLMLIGEKLFLHREKEEAVLDWRQE